MQSLARLLAYAPLGVLHFLGWWSGWLAFLGSPTYRRRLLENSKQAGYGAKVWLSAVGHAGRMGLELPRIWWGKPCANFWVAPQVLEQAHAQGRGVIMLTPHLGAFEMMGQAYAVHFAKQFGAMTALYRPARKTWQQALMRGSRERHGLQMVPTNGAGVRQMLKALRQGKIVGLLPDQVPPQGLGVWSSFFGKPAYTMTLAAKLALQTDAVVVVCRVERLSWGRGFKIYNRLLANPLPTDLQSAVDSINVAMQEMINECPQQYLWGYGRYKQPRQMDTNVKELSQHHESK